MDGELKVTDHKHGLSFITLDGTLETNTIQIKETSKKNIGMLSKANDQTKKSAKKVLHGVKSMPTVKQISKSASGVKGE